MLATLSSPPVTGSRHSLDHFDDPFAELLRQMRTLQYVALVEPDGTVHRVSRVFDSTQDERDLTARCIRAIRREVLGDENDLRVGVVRYFRRGGLNRDAEKHPSDNCH
ncbi:hypothetical protein U8335_19595 [Roseiconus lacunae]|uniref:hypothetical protein n=1 Tax=Roseiconus lacunae TaxID=2605694 RepID=UPI003088DB87|nr:hypothetical protein U8335_19595 [Stieleria sp. HD01]